MGRRKQAPGNPQLAVAYLRASTSHQDLSPEAQRAAICTWAAANEVTVMAWHYDKGVGGGSEMEDRPELMVALEDLRVHRARWLIVARRDRLARDGVVAGLIERAAARVGALVVSADGLGNGDAPADRLLRGVLDHVAAYEAAVIRMRIKAALAVKKARRERVGAVQYGWQLGSDGRQLEPLEVEQAVIRTAAKLRADGATYRKIASELSRRGHVSRAGRVFDPQQVRRMLAGVTLPTTT